MSLSFEEKREIFEELKRELMETQKIYVETCRNGVVLPTYKKIGDSGMDVQAAEDCIIRPGETLIVPTGLIVAIPQGLELQVRPRCGVSLNQPLRVANAPGTIDSGYRDEVGIILHNESAKKYNIEIIKDGENYLGKLVEVSEYPVYTVADKGNNQGIYQIRKGDRIAQLVLAPVLKAEWEQVEPGRVKEIGINRGGGFGHTGTN